MLDTLTGRSSFASASRSPKLSSFLPEYPSEEELAKNWSLSEVDRKFIGQCRGEDNKRRFALQLCTLRTYGRFLGNYANTPTRIINHLGAQLDLNPLLFMDISSQDATEYRYQKKIRDYLGYEPFSEASQEKIKQWIYEQTIRGCLPDEIRRKIEESLRSSRIVLPGASTLDDLVSSGCSDARKVIFERITACLPEGFCQAIDDLLHVAEGESHSSLFRLKQFPPEASAGSIMDYIEKYKLLLSIDVPAINLSKFGPDLVRHLAQLTKGYDVWEIKRFSLAAKRYALTAAFLIEALKTILDHLIEMHDQYVTRMCRRARRKYEKRHREMRLHAQNGTNRLLRAVELLIDHDGPRESLIEALFSQIEDPSLREALADCRAFKKLDERGYLFELENSYSWLRRYLPSLLTLPFKAEPGADDLTIAIQLINQVNDGILKKLPEDAPTSFVQAAWWPYLKDKNGNICQRIWEISLALAVRESLRSGDLFLPGSRRHVSFWNLIYNEEKWQTERQGAYVSLGLPHAFDQIHGRLGNEFDNIATLCERGLPSNPMATIRDGRLRLKCQEGIKESDRVKELRGLIETRMPKIRIERLLLEVDAICGFSGYLEPLGGYEPRSGNIHQVLLATLIAHGTNLGISGMGNSAESITADMLQHASQWFLRDSTLRAANTALVNYHSSMPMSTIWGDTTRSSSDGQRFGIQKSSLIGSFYPRYFGHYDRAITVYTHASDQYSVFSTQVISCSAREALYVLDGLLAHDTALRPHAHSTDTHGYTEHLFGLCYLLGFSFMPRIKDLHKQQLYKIDRTKNYGVLEPLFRGTVDMDIVREQWDQLVRVAASIMNRTAPPSVIMRRLASSSPSDRLAKALTALSRVVKTAYILRYVHDLGLRQQVQLQLNRGEARHELARWIFFANQGEFRTGDFEEIMNKASCLSLLSNAILTWNTVEYQRIVSQLRETGHTIENQDLARIAPIMHRHVIPNGTYSFK